VENTRFQINCLDATYATAVALAEAVKSAMKASSLTNLLLLEQDQFEPDALLHRVILDFSLALLIRHFLKETSCPAPPYLPKAPPSVSDQRPDPHSPSQRSRSPTHAVSRSRPLRG
jgi:hypothetical protein